MPLPVGHQHWCRPHALGREPKRGVHEECPSCGAPWVLQGGLWYMDHLFDCDFMKAWMYYNG